MTIIQSAYDRFCKERFPLPSESQLSALEERIGVIFPDDYRRFVLEFNGGYFKCPEITPVGDGCPQATLDSLYGIGASHRTAELGRPQSIALFDDNDPPKIVPIGYTGMGGLIILDTAPGEGQGTIFLKKEFGDFYYLTDGIEDFFALLREPTWD
jgi:SMI1-KNR4 cell-wall